MNLPQLQTQTKTTTFLQREVPTTQDFERLVREWKQRLVTYEAEGAPKFVDNEYLEIYRKRKWAESMISLLEACLEGNENALATFADYQEQRARFNQTQRTINDQIEKLKSQLNASGAEYARVQGIVMHGAW
jgi:hypothetical protein